MTTFIQEFNASIMHEVEILTRELKPDGELLILPYSVYETVPDNVLRLFMHFQGLYCIPTTELICFLADVIGSRKAIEIGAGNGDIAKALNIPATDSKLQVRPDIKLVYELAKQPTINYPDFILKYEAIDAVKHFLPEVVIGSYITHVWNGKTGNAWGVEERNILPLIQTYIHIGDEITHALKPLMQIPFTIFRPDWLIVRGDYGYIGLW